LLTPYKFQKKIIDRHKTQKAMALLMEAGTGKTMIAINWFREKFNLHGELLPTIVFCPIIVLNNWRDEILQCSHIKVENIGVVMGSKKKRLDTIKNPKHKILIVNYEANRSDEILKALIDFKARVVICDESHKIKNPRLLTAKRKKTTTGAVLEISKDSWYRAIMSGTPNPAPEDIWSQYYFLDRGEVFGEKFYSFKNKYFVNKNANWKDSKAFPDWRFIESKAPEYKQNLARYATSMKREECLDLPDLIQQRVEVEPSPEMLKHYNELKRDLITWLDGQEENPLAVQNALTKTLRLSEILSGYMRLEDESLVSFQTNPTLDTLLELIESIGKAKVIVFCNFKQNYVDIAKALDKKKIKYVEIHGGISTKQKLANVDLFNDLESDVQVCIANPASGGVGINLKSAGYTIYYSMGHSLIDFEQSLARNYRSGSIDLHQKITHYYLYHKGLMSELVIDAVLNKKRLADNLLNLKERLCR